MKRIILSRAIPTILLLLGAAIILLPFVWMLSLSVKPRDEIFSTAIQLLPSRFEWGNFTYALTQTDIPLFLWNGVVMVPAQEPSVRVGKFVDALVGITNQRQSCSGGNKDF